MTLRMSRCQVCMHRNVSEINAHLIDGEMTITEMCRHYGLSEESLNNHKRHHLKYALTLAVQATDLAFVSNSPLAKLEQVTGRAAAVLAVSERHGDVRTVLSAIRELRECIRLEAMLRGTSGGDDGEQAKVTIAWPTINAEAGEKNDESIEGMAVVVDADSE